jgi:hypothetical protein
MRQNEREKIRQVLEAALERLAQETGEARAGSESIAVFSEPAPSSGDLSDSPLLVVVAGDLKEPLHNAPGMRAGTRGDAESLAATNSSISDQHGRKVSHPGLERFNIVEGVEPGPAPKACFIEPGRSCVNSGACEMRGF